MKQLKANSKSSGMSRTHLLIKSLSFSRRLRYMRSCGGVSLFLNLHTPMGGGQLSFKNKEDGNEPRANNEKQISLFLTTIKTAGTFGTPTRPCCSGFV